MNNYFKSRTEIIYCDKSNYDDGYAVYCTARKLDTFYVNIPEVEKYVYYYMLNYYPTTYKTLVEL